MPVTKTDTSLLITDGKSGDVVFRLNRKTKRGEYTLSESSPQHQWVSNITVLGFGKFPSGLKQNGMGFVARGYLLLKQLAEEFEEYEFTIHATESSSVKKEAGVTRVVINHGDLKGLLQQLRTIGSEAFDAQKSTVTGFLGHAFPTHFTPTSYAAKKYQKNSIANLLAREEVVKNPSLKDIEKLQEFFPLFLGEYGSRLKGISKLLAISKSKQAVEIVYLEKLIQEYEKRLRSKSQNENAWQKFLSQYILVFNSNYASSLEKESISLQGKYPDFLLIDAYKYLDIYEIKKPSTNLLKKDRSRGNYYWDVEIAKAISQVENYIHYAEKNGSALREDIKRRKGVDVRVMKPRGLIIAGERRQLKDEIMEDNFRLLNKSLKNLEIILYDELLDRLKLFLSRLKK